MTFREEIHAQVAMTNVKLSATLMHYSLLGLWNNLGSER